MSAEIVALMRELKAIYSELKRTNEHLKAIRTRKTDIETMILEYLDQVDEPGIRYEDITVVRQKRLYRQRKAVTQKRDEIVRLLEENGINDADGLYKEIQERLKGEAEEVNTLKVKEKKSDE